MNTDPIDQALLDLLADHEPSHPIDAHFGVMAVEAGITPTAADAIRRAWALHAAGQIDAFEVDGLGPFFALAGHVDINDLPKTGDEIEMVLGDSTPRCSTAVPS